jgi:hypothetical protein
MMRHRRGLADDRPSAKKRKSEKMVCPKGVF